MTPTVLKPDRSPERLPIELGRFKVEREPASETERVLNDPDLMDSIRQSREQRRKGKDGTSLEKARREILGENG